ncbi:transcription factor [Dorcoceras hygrometricum]|uniref:Transcription factor n=1 Tax=Dorcoceras hygrometricum TaxID=472368 RepID=A0A2Z7A6L9_9LAMI|nr:transcription factor [Dorcoceras hygrometricum]
MNQGVVHGSQMVAAGSPNWWSVSNMATPPRHQHQPFLAAPPPPHNCFPNQFNDGQEFPDSWSQLLLGSEQVDEEAGCRSSTGTKQMQAKNMEKYYEEQLMNQIISNNYSCFADLKQDQNLENYGAGISKPFNFWAPQMLSASSPKSCVTDLSSEMFDFSHKTSEWKIVNRRDYSDPSYECNSTARGGANKKARIQPTSSQTTCKARKETVRDKITAIHQLVSPFGKTDTASVLLEALGYIRFLQNQIEALSQPYLGSVSRNLRNQLPLESDKREANKDLRSRGLCLVPVSCTFHLGSDNAADYWAPSPFAANIR